MEELSIEAIVGRLVLAEAFGYSRPHTSNDAPFSECQFKTFRRKPSS